MILLALALILIATFLYNPRSLPYLLVTYFVFYDMFDGFYEEAKLYSVIRYIVPLLLIGIYTLKYNVLKKPDVIFVILIAYLLLLWVFNPGDPIVSARNLFAVLITLMFIPIGKQLAER